MLTIKTKVRTYEACVLSALLYGSKTWATYAGQERKLNTFHLRCLRKIIGIRWDDRKTNIRYLKKHIFQAYLPSYARGDSDDWGTWHRWSTTAFQNRCALVRWLPETEPKEDSSWDSRISAKCTNLGKTGWRQSSLESICDRQWASNIMRIPSSQILRQSARKEQKQSPSLATHVWPAEPATEAFLQTSAGSVMRDFAGFRPHRQATLISCQDAKSHVESWFSIGPLKSRVFSNK